MRSQPFAETREALHTLAEHILAAARYHATGHIGLQVIQGGFATPPFGDDHRTISVEGTEVVVRVSGQERRTPITTLRAAGEFADVEPGAPSNVYKPATACDLDARLMVDADAARRMADWYAVGDAALRRLTLEIADDQPSDLTLWPEHFDVAIRADEVNYGASPGDARVPEPYLYVGPTGLELAATGDSFWNQPFGAAITWEDVRSVEDAVEFFRQGRQHAAG
ncbi:MAG TPA: hypothetical protein VHS79_14015 [Actinomycetes bacterium]|jgi:hypothetical protein|nr:hypothetical protein [Actinomycetes bacterium]